MSAPRCRGADSFIAVIYDQLILMRNLLADDGSIHVHCDPRANAFMHGACDEVFGRQQFVNEVIWRRAFAHNDPTRYGNIG